MAKKLNHNLNNIITGQY